jgi:hypothetical protein
MSDVVEEMSVRIRERKVPVRSLRRAGRVFDASRPRSALKMRPRKKSKYTKHFGDSKLHKLANWNRPQGDS